eukprot:CAMPEP_0197657180 /NCGR_PEP_ID=MMETSP1338-20131121/44473_1 /TAXON_ID=43686 ORGANISM="Pelagodinium beii, Strain RCC1491" /NCGR_SAMPLE_ID=MMETSP1338 /ASSEMBLY_ACC=CAM_ASM_000754 /LENGTH=192 /DNA_ID=CAMNT_0043233493 /DNA_START=51 /DNA_END=626 /DNA_ORIENTATION=+
MDNLIVQVRKLDGEAVLCCMARDSTVADLLQEVLRQQSGGEDGSYLEAKMHRAQVEAMLLTENGYVMLGHLRLSDYDLGEDNMVTVVMKMRFQGSYSCWLALDHAEAPHHVEHIKFNLEITEDAVCINGIPGVIGRKVDVAGETEVEAKFSEAVVFKSDRPWSKSQVRATACIISMRSADYKKLTNPGEALW